MILALIPSCIGQDFTILGQNSQILCKNREKLENIISMHICWWIGTKVCNVVLHIITKNIKCMLQSWIRQDFVIYGQNSQNSMQKSWQIGKYYQYPYLLLHLHLGSTVLLYSIIKIISCAAKWNRSRLCFFEAKWSNSVQTSWEMGKCY